MRDHVIALAPDMKNEQVGIDYAVHFAECPRFSCKPFINFK